MEGLLTTGDVAKFCRVSEVTVHLWVKQGLLKPLKAGRLNRFTKDELERFLSRDEPKSDTEAK